MSSMINRICVVILQNVPILRNAELGLAWISRVNGANHAGTIIASLVGLLVVV